MIKEIAFSADISVLMHAGCEIDLKGTAGAFLVDSYHDYNCKYTIGKEQGNINFVVVKLQQYCLNCWGYHHQMGYIEVADISNQYRVRKPNTMRSSAVLVKNRPAVVRYRWYWHWYWHWYRDRITTRVSFYIILKNMTGANNSKWNPTLAQSNAGAVTVTWDQSMLPSKNYIVVPLYNYSATEGPLLYDIEYRSDSSCAVEYLKPDALYSFQVIALDSNSTKSSWIVSSLRTMVMKNDTFRLIGGQLPNEGIVEVFKSGFWHRICQSHSWWWSHNESKVVCRSLGLQNPRLYYDSLTFFSAHLQYLAGFRCSGTETSLNDCHHINDLRATSRCYENNYFNDYPGYFVCGSPPVSQHNVTQMAGTITSPGYPNYMIQTDSRWIFSHNITRGRVVLYFDELDLRRRIRGTSSVHIKELTLSFSKWYKTYYHGSRLGMLLTLPAQITFYSSCTSQLEGGNYGKGIRFRYLVYSEPEDGVPTLKNWTIELSSPTYSTITATWDRLNFTDYDILGFWMNCNSTQEWATEIPYVIGGSSITSLSCGELIGYTHYKVQVLVQLRKRRDGSFFTYQSLNASITTKESSPKTFPPGLHATNIEENKATVTWQPIPRNNTHGVLLGYIVNVYSYYSSSNVKVVTNRTSIVITNLVPATGYQAGVEGYTSVGSGPRGSTHFAARCGRSIKNQLHGKIHLSNVYVSVDCVWRLNTPTANTLVLLVMETIEMPLSFLCKSFYVAITDGLGNQLTKLCGSKRSLSFVSIGSTEIKVHLQRATSGTPIMSASFVMLVNGIGTIPYSIQPWSVSVTSNSSTSVSVSWGKYPGKEYVSKYIVICIANNRHGNISAAYTASQKYNAMVQNLLKYTEYKVVVVAIFGNSSFNSTSINETMVKGQEVVCKTAEDVPSKPPRDITAKYLGSNTLVVYWKRVDNEFTNGKVIGYYVYYRVAWSGSSWTKEYVTSDKTEAYLKNLKDVTQYRIEVSAATKIGEGPKSRGYFVKTGSSQIMYSFGLSEGDLTITSTGKYLTRCVKISFNEEGFLFFTGRRDNIYICHNGVIRFGSSSYLHWPTPFIKHSTYCSHDILAPYWSLTDRNHGQVYYHVYTLTDNTEKSRKVLDQAAFDVLQLQQQPSFPKSFRASWVLVVTWDKIRHSTYNQDTKNLTNTFQAVLIADDIHSFAIFNYPTDGIQWSAPTSRQKRHLWNTGKDRTLPVVGWNAAGLCESLTDHFFNVETSGTVNIDDIDTIQGQSVYTTLQNRRKFFQKENGIQGKWFFELYLPWRKSGLKIDCKSWFKEQPDPRPFLEYLQPCPCTSRQGWFDERFTPLTAAGDQSTERWSWRSSPRPCVISTFPSIDGWKQKCCYSHKSGQWGALLVGHPNGGHSLRDANDSIGYQYCCIDSNRCHLFYQKRPSDDCSNYEPPEWSWMWGDPHFVTLDGKNYTFNGLGEYVMLDARDGFFQLQSRTRLAKGQGTATLFSAAVMKERNCSTLQLNLAENGTMLLLIDGDIMSFENIGNESKRLNGSVVVARPQENSFKATYPSGISVTLTESKGALSILVALPKSFKNQTRGLLGTWNDNKVDDFTTPSGYALPHNATGRTIHFDFGQKWQVNETTSLFTYNANESVSSFTNSSFVPMFVDELKFANKSLEKQALAECNSDINCLFDAASTNDISVGLDTKVVGSQMVNDSVILSNSPPRFSNESSVVILKVNATKHLSITVEDKDGDSVNVNVSRSPKGAIVKSNSSTVSISWLVSMEEISQEFIATDSKGAVAILRPSYYLCACHNGATCIESKDDIERQGEDRFQILPCQCKSGYTGKYCENDIDACSVNLNPCYPGVKCKDLPAPANESGYECGSCPSGFSGNGDSCQDIDECWRSSHGCSQLCFNTPGSFVCDCEKGYTLESDGSSCKDVNECEPSSDCMQICVNTPGSYNCSCNEDFKVDPLDSKKCIPRSPCNESNSCQQICYESNDIAKCACYMGYQVQADNASCADIDECGTQKDRCNQICHNKEGGYNCTCLKGFRLSSDNVTCVDINECIEWTFDCSAPLRCRNTIGSYNCSCEDGLNWIDGDCREPLKEEKKPSTSSPSTKPITDSPEDIRNAVRVTIKEVSISELDQQFDLKFKKSVAGQVTAFCAKNDICLQPKGRERRSDGTIFFSSNEVIVLQDYPKQIANINAVVAFYVKAPTAVNLQHAVSIDGAILFNIINGSLENIGNDIGKILLSVSRYQTVTDPTTTQSLETTAAGYVPKDNNKLFYIIGGSVGGAIALFVLLALIARCCKRQPEKEASNKEDVVDVELKPYPPRSFTFENPNAVVDI